MHALQFTPEQAAKRLELTPGVVQRLSQYFRIPPSYYDAPAGQPRILLYHETDLALLKKIQQLLIQGYSLTEIKPLLAEELEMLQQAASVPEKSGMASAMQTENTMMEYDHSDHLKEQLAEVTFKQYRQTNNPKAPFKRMLEELETPRPRRSPINAVPSKRPMKSGMSNPLATADTMPGMLPSASPWMTPDLRDRAAALKQELFRNLVSNHGP